eukprot:4310852-Amphidinium_carterae.1
MQNLEPKADGLRFFNPCDRMNSPRMFTGLHKMQEGFLSSRAPCLQTGHSKAWATTHFRARCSLPPSKSCGIGPPSKLWLRKTTSGFSDGAPGYDSQDTIAFKYHEVTVEMLDAAKYSNLFWEVSAQVRGDAY